MRLVCIALIVCIYSLSKAQQIKTLPADTWKGFERSNFTIDGYKAYYVKPAAPCRVSRGYGAHHSPNGIPIWTACCW